MKVLLKKAEDGGISAPEGMVRWNAEDDLWAVKVRRRRGGESKLDRDCWVVRNVTGSGGYRWYRLDVKDGEVEKKLTYVGPRKKDEGKWTRKKRREDKYGERNNGGWE